MKNLPDYREKQKILYISRQSDKDLIAYGDLYLELGRTSDATDFYHKANHLPGLEKIKEMAEADGDIMAYQYILKALKQHATDNEWNRIGERALDLQKYAFALHAFKHSNNTAKIEEVTHMMAPEDQIKTL
jgi:hypothetical protein